ncbi:alpha/beta fold hydrolase [Streptomyces sp. Ag109_G2-15]|uniref:alpha/beta fold hydrolase n=1 Tax=Streptomyces sp. Ag109_G2-15 TaxID=1938850 RepID=UPI000BD3C9D1|nr:alpha/beta hydrolase [Streptomyces sp. Ag109_G2-15]SOE07552.1 Pimeloyl-ACP methyl ester carboxylesterase [Streptomyces sp. Ag109_G2-15]
MSALPNLRTVVYADDYARPASPGWRGIDWVARERDFSLHGRRVHYVDHGSGGEAFVLVHGMGGRWQHWLENIPALARRGRVVALDLPGFGRSEAPRSGYSLDGFADAAAALCHELGLRRAVFLGHSLGGPVAIRFAVRHPELVRAIVPVAGAVDLFGDVLSGLRMPKVARISPRTVTSTVFEVLTAGLPVPALLRHRVAAAPRLRRLVLWPYLNDPVRVPPDLASVLVDGAGARGVLPTARALAGADAFAGITRVRCPVLVVNGDRDPISPLSRLDGFARTTAPLEAAVIEHTGHLPMLERPDAFNAVVGRFLDTLGD